ncbi:mercury transporter [Vallitalea guaymasensis]|uniref:Mercury transporter n=1 Tax=Vallitalea guaymasensis TaxID=1185412 RepID=A0A8J8MDM0_9FIRM|nr:mercury transporter [Vallitalea guaymasensis]QUH31109.1 mercury transporter [Vallitalea guaymasensis]
MDMIKELSDAFLILIRSGTVFRVIYCFVMMGTDEENEKAYKKKIRNVIVFYILAESCYVIKDLVTKYYT